MNEEIVAGALYVVSTPIGNLADISRRAEYVLSNVRWIAAEDTRTTRILLKHLSIATPLLSYHSHNERQRIPDLLARLRAGDAVALVTDAGTPGISDPAYGMIKNAIDAGVRVIPVPGASAVLPALVASGLPTDRFVFEGFLPAKKGRKTRLEQLRQEERTIVLYESPHRLERTLNDLYAAFGERRIALVREITKRFEEVVRGSLSSVIDHVRGAGVRGEYVIVVAGTSFRDSSAAEVSSGNS